MRASHQLLICGNYGFNPDTIDGQMIKTRALKDALSAAFGNGTVTALNTSTVFRRPWAFYWAAKEQFARSTHVIVLPGPRGIHVILPLFMRWKKKKKKRDVRYVAIGGWLPDHLVKHPRLLRLCSQLDGIYVETQSMAARLMGLGLGNVHILPNFRSFDRAMMRTYVPAGGSPLKLVFCARVLKEKGVEEAIEAVNRLNAGSMTPVASLNIYGPVPDSYRARVADILHGSAHIRYCGVLRSEELYAVLQTYDLLLFPTHYADEGFPGTVLDAFIAGVPVVASDWMYSRDIIEDGRTGAICRSRSCDDLTETLRRYVAAPELLAQMRERCVERAQQFHVDHALAGLLLDLGATGYSE